MNYLGGNPLGSKVRSLEITVRNLEATVETLKKQLAAVAANGSTATATPTVVVGPAGPAGPPGPPGPAGPPGPMAYIAMPQNMAMPPAPVAAIAPVPIAVETTL
jgi:hypothetical protein